MRDEYVHPHNGEERRKPGLAGEAPASPPQHNAWHPADPRQDAAQDSNSTTLDSGPDWNRSGSLRQDYGDFGHAMDDRRQAQETQRRNPGNEPHPYAGHRGRPPKGYSRSDERMREDVCERLMANPHVDAGDVTVEVNGGVVTLEGSVSGRNMLHELESVAGACLGVTKVDNRVRVNEHASEAGSQAARVYSTAQGYARDGGKAAAGIASSRVGQSQTSDTHEPEVDQSRFIRTHTD